MFQSTFIATQENIFRICEADFMIVDASFFSHFLDNSLHLFVKHSIGHRISTEKIYSWTCFLLYYIEQISKLVLRTYQGDK